MVEIAALVGDTARATMLAALMSGQALTSSELAGLAHVSRATASEHLGKLTRARLLAVTQKRRNRYYRIASPLVARMLESIKSVAALETPARYQLRSAQDDALRFARTCYDHLAGQLGVAIADALARKKCVVLSDEGGELTAAGKRFLTGFGSSLLRQPSHFLPSLPGLERAAISHRRPCRRRDLSLLSRTRLACPSTRVARYPPHRYWPARSPRSFRRGNGKSR